MKTSKIELTIILQHSAENDTPPKPFGGAGAQRPAKYIHTEARGRFANDNLGFPKPDNDNRPSKTIRQEMDERLILPRGLIDGFTGQPILDGKSRKWNIGPISYFILNAAAALGAAAATATVVTWVPALAPVAVPWMMLVQTGRLRKMQTHVGHEASHSNIFLSNDPRRGRTKPIFLGMNANDLIGELATTLALSPNMEEYRNSHEQHHDIETYTTAEDPDAAYVKTLKSLARALLDPRAYYRDFAARLRSNLLATKKIKQSGIEEEVPYWERRLMGSIWVLVLTGSATALPVSAWLLSVFLPWVVLFRVSAILQILSLHAWNLPRAATFQDYANRTYGRFSGIPLPARGLKGLSWLKAWSVWWAEILLLELPFRLGVLSSDLQAHDIHHLEWILAFDMKSLSVFIDDWRNQPFRRAEVIEQSGDPLNMAKRELWGVRAMWAIARQNLRRLQKD